MTINEPFFQGHFPGQPVMPGVLSLEIMAQAESFLMLSQIKDPLSMNMFFEQLKVQNLGSPLPRRPIKSPYGVIKKKN